MDVVDHHGCARNQSSFGLDRHLDRVYAPREWDMDVGLGWLTTITIGCVYSDRRLESQILLLFFITTGKGQHPLSHRTPRPLQVRATCHLRSFIVPRRFRLRPMRPSLKDGLCYRGLHVRALEHVG